MRGRVGPSALLGRESENGRLHSLLVAKEEIEAHAVIRRPGTPVFEETRRPVNADAGSRFRHPAAGRELCPHPARCGAICCCSTWVAIVITHRRLRFDFIALGCVIGVLLADRHDAGDGEREECENIKPQHRPARQRRRVGADQRSAGHAHAADGRGHSNDLVYDLGAGDGKIAIAAAKQFGAKAVGVEYNPDMAKLAQCFAEAEGVADKVRIVQGDIFETDFSSATVVTLYLLPELNLRLRPTILKMKPGTRVVSHSFLMDDWRPDESSMTEDGAAYLWIVPGGGRGQWTFKQQGGNDTLRREARTNVSADSKAPSGRARGSH